MYVHYITTCAAECIVTYVCIILGSSNPSDTQIISSDLNVDGVINLAAQVGVRYSLKNPLAYIKTNIEGTYNILESAKNLNIAPKDIP